MSQARMKVAAMVLTASTLVGVATHEQWRGEAYIPVPGDVPTIDYGRTKGVKMGDRSTPERGLQYLLADLENVYAAGVKRCVKAPLYQHEFDAFVSLTYNIGVGAFCRSTLVRKANAEDYAGACKEILRWNRAGGKVLRGLTIRREAEYRQCMGIDNGRNA